MSDLTGKTLGQYTITREIGRGGMAVVYEAYQPSLGRHVALKVLPAQFTFDGVFVERFLHEARAAARLAHPNIVPIYDVGSQDDQYYIVMQKLPGEALSGLIAHGGRLSLPRAAHIVAQVAAALDYAHQRGFVHRDVKSGNVIVGPDDHVWLTDFGIARAMEGTRLTQSGMVMGTPEYMSPEQAQGEEAGPAGDVYALGIVLYEMLAGRVPFQGRTPLSVLHKQIYDAPPGVRSTAPDLPPPIEAILARALEKDPARRFATAGELARAVEVLARPVIAPPAAPAPAAHPVKPATLPAGKPVAAHPAEPAPVVRAPAAPPAPETAPGGHYPVFPIIAGAAAVVLVVAALAVLVVPRLLPPRRPGGTAAIVTPVSPTAAPIAVAPSVTLAAPPGTATVMVLPGVILLLGTAPSIGSPTVTAAGTSNAEPTSTLAPIHTATLPAPAATRTPVGGGAPTPTPALNTSAVPPRLLAPDDGASGSEIITFRWEPGGSLPAGAQYEVVVWNADAPADDAAQGIAAPTNELYVKVNLDSYWGNLFTTPEFKWTVLVVYPGPVGVYRRLTLPSKSYPRRFTYRAPEPTSEPQPISTMAPP